MFLVQTIFPMGLIALVTTRNRNQLRLIQCRRKTEVFMHIFPHNIVAIHMNPKRLVVFLENSISILDIRELRHLHTIQESPSNELGVSALCQDVKQCYLAYPESTLVGDVRVFDTVRLKSTTVIHAHESPVAVLAFNAIGTLIATASGKGTLIRVFAVSDGEKLYEFRRGVKRCESVFSLSFFNSTYLTCSTSMDTIHVFKLDLPVENKSETKSVWMDYLDRALKTSAWYLSTEAAEVLTSERSFAYARLPFNGWKVTSRVVSLNGKPILLVTTDDGFLHVYGIDAVNGGLCVKQNEISFVENNEEISYRRPAYPTTDFIPVGVSPVQTRPVHSTPDSRSGTPVPFSVSTSILSSDSETTDLFTELPSPRSCASVVKRWDEL